MKTILSLLLTLFLGIAQHDLHADTTPTPPTTLEAPQVTPPGIKPAPSDEEPYFPLQIEEPSPQSNKFLVEFLNMLATLGFIIALILIVAWFLKRFVNARLEQVNASSSIQVIEKRGLSPKSMLYLLRVENKTILVAESQHGVTALTEFDTPIETEPAASQEFPSPFSKLLEKKK